MLRCLREGQIVYKHATGCLAQIEQIWRGRWKWISIKETSWKRCWRAGTGGVSVNTASRVSVLTTFRWSFSKMQSLAMRAWEWSKYSPVTTAACLIPVAVILRKLFVYAITSLQFPSDASKSANISGSYLVLVSSIWWAISVTLCSTPGSSL